MRFRFIRTFSMSDAADAVESAFALVSSHVCVLMTVSQDDGKS